MRCADTGQYLCLQAISDWAKSRTLQQQRQFLPVYDCREELLQVIRENQVVVVVGETGSGKTTQVGAFDTAIQRHKKILIQILSAWLLEKANPVTVNRSSYVYSRL